KCICRVSIHFMIECLFIFFQELNEYFHRELFYTYICQDYIIVSDHNPKYSFTLPIRIGYFLLQLTKETMRSWFTMKACGLIVEYNPFHNGHLHHVEQAKEISGAECIIAVMSGSFLQRGEPAIIDKYHRTLAALKGGVDLVVELPYTYAVQSSHLFATGAVKTLNEMGASSICFGSESGNVARFVESYHHFSEHKDTYIEVLRKALDQGKSYPSASEEAYHEIGMTSQAIDLTQPNNILGYSYIKAIKDHQLSIQPLTIKRTKSGYHDESISD